MTGCAAVNYAPSASTVPALSGVAHGGQSPIQGATVTLYVTPASATSYGAAATVIGSATTDVNGNFAIAPSANSTNCPSGQQAYITAAGGYPSGNAALANTSTLLMAALGDCKNINSNTSVLINEVTTVAAAYALSGFITTSASGSLYKANISGPSATGLAHAFLNAANLASYSTGAANATISVSSGGTTATGTVPAVEINTLANAMSACVNTATASSNCTSLFGFTPSISQVAPANTLQAFVNLARNPYPGAATMNSTTGLISLGNTTGAPFVSYLSAPPIDWSLSIVYTGGPIAAGYWIALDANDTAYVDLLATTSTTPLLFGLSAYGNTVPAFAINSGTGTATKGIAPDALGNIWVADNSTHAYRFSTSTGALASTYTSTVGATFPLAVDAQNNLWIGHAISSGTNAVEEVANSGGTWATSGPTLTASVPAGPEGITVDANQNIWPACTYTTTTGNNTKACLLANTGSVASPVYSATSTATPITATLTSSAYSPFGVSMDAAGNAWHTIYGGGTSYTTGASSTSGIMEVVPSTTLNPTSVTPGTFLLNSSHATTGAYSTNDIGDHTPEESAIDGAGTMFMGDVYSNVYGVHAYSTTTGNTISPTLGFISCYLATTTTTTCATTSTTPYAYPTYQARGIAIDSTGSVWVDNSATGYATVTQLIGLAAPTNPLLSAGKPGLSPGLTTFNPLP